MSFHRKSVGLEVHVPHTFVYADAAARAAAVSSDFVTDPVNDPTGDTNLFKLARQTSDKTYWVLEQINPSVSWNQLGGAGGTPDLPFTTATDPAVDAAVTTAIIDLNSGTVVTLTVVGNSQILGAPSDTTAGRKFFVLNNDTSNNSITVNGVALAAAQYAEFRWDGTAWLFTTGGAAGGAGGVDEQIQYNKGGVLAGDANNTWDDVTKRQKLLGSLLQRGGEPTNLYTPTIVSETSTGVNPRYSVAQGNFLYVVDSSSDDLRIFDITDKAAPRLVNLTPLIVGASRGCAISGSTLYITGTDSGGTITSVDVSNKSTPVILDVLVIGGAPRGCRVSGPTVFVTSNVASLAIQSIDASDPKNLKLLQSLSQTGAGRNEFEVQGTVLYALLNIGNANFVIVDVSDPSAMSNLSIRDIGQDPQAVTVYGAFAYVVDTQSRNFQVFDITDPTSTAVAVGSLILPDPSSVRAITVGGNFAYIVDANANDYKVIDISDPTAPVMTSTSLILTGANPVAMTTIGRHSYVLDNTGDKFFIIDNAAVQAQAAFVDHLEAGNLAVVKDAVVGANLGVGSSLTVGKGGIFSDGPIITGGRPLGGKPQNVVEIYNEDDFPITGGDIVLAPGVVYRLMASVTTDKQILHPVSATFNPAEIQSSSKQLNTLTSTGSGGAFLRTLASQGQLVFRNIIIKNTGSRMFADISGNAQNGFILELNDADVFDFDVGTRLENMFFIMSKDAFLQDSGDIELVDCAATLSNIFGLNTSDTALPTFDVKSSAGSVIPTLFSVRDARISNEVSEAFFMLHSNLIAGSVIRITGVEPSPFTPGTGQFFFTEAGNITALADSSGAPGVRTLVTSAGHNVADGDTVVHAGFAVATQLNGTFVASNIGVNSYEVTAVFTVTDTGSFSNASLDQDSVLVDAFRNPGQEDSRAIGSFHVNSNAVATAIVTLNTYTDLNLNAAALPGSNIKRWSLTNTTTGELTYNGIEPFSGTIFAQLSTLGETGSPEFRFRAVKNGAVLPDGIETVREAGAVQIVTTGLVAPVSVVNGDKIRLQVNNIDDATDITIAHLSVSIQ